MAHPNDQLRAQGEGSPKQVSGSSIQGVREILTMKRAFVPSPQTQQQVQAAAASGQAPPVQQDANSNAVSPGGVTLDDVVAMLEQMHGEISGALVTVQNAISEMRSALPSSGSSGEKKPEAAEGASQDPDRLKERVAQLEQMLAGAQAQQAQGQQAAQPQ